VVRLSILVVGLALISPAFGQESSSTQGPPAPATPPQTGISADVAKAEDLIVKKDWKGAETVLDAWLAGHADDARALFDAGYIADAQGRNDDAIGLYRKAVAADPNSFEAQISLGLLLARLNKAAEARPVLEAATTLNPDPPTPAAKAKAWRALAKIDEAGIDGKPDAAQASIDLLEALKLSPETPEDTAMAAHLAEMNDDSAGAEAAYRRLLKNDPDSSAAQAGLAHLLIAQKKYSEAEELLKAALKKSPDDAAMTAQLAAVLVAEDKAEALPLVQSYHDKHPQDTTITLMLAQVQADAGEYEESDKLYVSLMAADPKDGDLLVGHGQNLIRLHRYAEALPIFQRAAQIDETNGDAWNGVAFASFELHQPAVTLQALTARSKYLPESATILFLWATAYDTLHDKKQAAAYYHKFLDASAGKLPDQEWQAKQRLALLEKSR